MPAYSGSFEYLDERGNALAQGACQVGFDQETCVVTPASGEALAFDLGDVDALNAGEWDLQMKLFTGRAVGLRKFGAAFGRMRDELTAAWRDRTVRCLLLEDLEEIARYQGAANGCPAEMRLYRSNLAILPSTGAPRQWRLADADAVRFDEAAYAVMLEFGAERLVLGKLAKKTGEFRGKLETALEALRANSAGALHNVFPFLTPDQLARLVAAMPEGCSVPLAALAAIHPALPAAIVERGVDARLKPYFDALRPLAAGGLMAGFKFIREDEEPGEAESEDEGPPFFWFFVPLPGDMVAWEASTGSGRATYFFRTGPGESAESAVPRLTRGLALVNFRREPVYLPDESLDRQQRFHRYAIACRKLPELRALRAAYLGRAIHSSPDAWAAQVEACGHVRPSGL